MIDKRKALAAQRVLMDNGIDADETGVVLQALGYALTDEEWEDVIEWEGSNIPYTDSIWEQKNKPWKSEAFTDFLNDVNQIATDKYGWNVAGHNFEDEECLELILIPAIGKDSENRKF